MDNNDLGDHLFLNKMDSVYLCLERKHMHGFECKAFDSYEEADQYHSSLCKKDPKYFGSRRSTMIPLANFTPKFYKEFWLQQEVAKIFIGRVHIIEEFESDPSIDSNNIKQ